MSCQIYWTALQWDCNEHSANGSKPSNSRSKFRSSKSLLMQWQCCHRFNSLDLNYCSSRNNFTIYSLSIRYIGGPRSIYLKSKKQIKELNSITCSTTIDRDFFPFIFFCLFLLKYLLSSTEWVSSHYIVCLWTIQLFNLFPIALIMTQHFLYVLLFYFIFFFDLRLTAIPSYSHIIRTNSNGKQCEE